MRTLPNDDDPPGELDTSIGPLAGLCLYHDFHLTMNDWMTWEDIARRLRLAGAELRSLSICAIREDGFDVRCRIRRMSPEAARAFVNVLLDANIAQRGSVEHLMLAR